MSYTWFPSEDAYQRFQGFHGGAYMAICFTKTEFAGDDPTPDFFDAVDIQLANSSSLLDGTPQQLALVFETRVLAGWYCPVKRSYGYVQMQVQPSTGSDNGLGTFFRFNDGSIHAAGGWVKVQWRDDNEGYSLYVHFADGGDSSNPLLLASISDTYPDGEADFYTVPTSQRP